MTEQFDLMMEFECGELTREEYLELFSMLVKNGHAWSLQGTYGRHAHSLIEGGYLNKEGDILRYPNEEF